MVIAPIVLLPREVNPLRVTKFIAHEIQVALARQRHCDESNEFMQSHSSEHFDSFFIGLNTHVGVYLFIE